MLKSCKLFKNRIYISLIDSVSSPTPKSTSSSPQAPNSARFLNTLLVLTLVSSHFNDIFLVSFFSF